jgi:BirA family biotin operon repressor/biotin-[acetyl-CoA-carboxylase] ligase
VSASFQQFSRRLLRAVRGRSTNWVVLSRVDSTNDLAKRIIARYAEDGRVPPAAVIIAWEQQAGRGRGENSWASPAGRGVYASLLVPRLPRSRLSLLPLAVGVRLATALESSAGLSIGLKWPNDLMRRGRKIGGILVETAGASRGSLTAVIGLGINYDHQRRDLPGARATSIALETSRLPNLVELTLNLIESVGGAVEQLGDKETWLELYRRLSLHREGDSLTCRTPEGVVSGTFVGLDPDGFLLLESAGTVRRVTAAELVGHQSVESEGRTDER